MAVSYWPKKLQMIHLTVEELSATDKQSPLNSQLGFSGSPISKEKNKVYAVYTMTQDCKRNRPNILVTGTPGTGKTTTSSALAESTQLRHVNIGELAREKNLHDGWDDELDCHVINEDLVFIRNSRRFLF